MKIVTILATLLMFFSIGRGDISKNFSHDVKEDTVAKAPWEERLYPPTFVTKIDDYYFIVDCWQHRIIYSKDFQTPVGMWETLDAETLGGPHSIASDGELLVVDNTGYHKVNVYRKNGDGKFILQQGFEGIGNRPHRVTYSPEKQGFYVLGSVSTDIYFFKNINGELQLQFTKKLDFLEDQYTRSFRIMDDKMYFVSGANKIVVVRYLDDSFEILEEYGVPNELAGMNDIYKIGNYYYITSTTSAKGEIAPQFIRTDNLDKLKDGLYEDLYAASGLKGTPYFFEKIEDLYYLTEITQYSSILRFKIADDEIVDFERWHDYGAPTEESENRKSQFPT